MPSGLSSRAVSTNSPEKKPASAFLCLETRSRKLLSVSLSPLSPLATASSRRLNQPCLRAVCACDPAPAARGARTAEQLGGSFQWRRVGDRVARAGGGAL